MICNFHVRKDTRIEANNCQGATWIRLLNPGGEVVLFLPSSTTPAQAEAIAASIKEAFA